MLVLNADTGASMIQDGTVTSAKIVDGTIAYADMVGTDIPMVGVGQTWQNVTASRALGVTYTNSTGKPIQIHVRASAATVGQRLVITINGVEAGASNGQGSSSATGSLSGIIIPPGATYTVATTGGHALAYWAELR